IGMIVTEQILISIVAIVVGIILGGLTSDLFVPMMEMVYNAAEQIPPFRVVAWRDDYYKIYAIIGVMLALGVYVISRIIAKIKIAQALKLGED
ncbi:MAG: ABC transporter permease, partial [Clostridiales bacterium]|nr:ABC transporter permease [Clostridiales bacterium]